MTRKAVVIILILSVLLLSPGMVSGTGSNVDPGLRFNADGTFKIMVIADIQDGISVDRHTVMLMEAALDQEQPDLVVLLGDNVYSLAPSIVISKSGTRKAVDHLLEPILQRGIPFCVVMGNHDSEASMPRKDLMLHFMSHEGCLASIGDNEPSIGDYQVTVKSSDLSRELLNLWFMDSGTYAPDEEGGGYAYVTDRQIAWYEQRAQQLAQLNGGEVLPALLFQHIPVPEIYQLLKEVPEGTPQSVKGHGIYGDRYYLPDPGKVTGGSLNEGPCPPDINNGQFESWCRQGDVIAAFFGHDHVNDFEGTYRGIDLVHTAGAGFYSYGNGDEHGVRIIELDERDVTGYSTRMVYYRDVVGKPIPLQLQGMGRQVFSWIVFACALLLAIVLSVVLLVRRRIRAKGGSRNKAVQKTGTVASG